MSTPSRPTSTVRPRLLLGAARHATRRRPFRLAVTLLLAAALVHASGRADDRAAARARAWGTTETVWVVAAPVPAGATLGADDVDRRPLPAIALPTDAASDSPIGRRTSVDLATGEIVRDGRLGRGGPLAAQLRDDEGLVTLTAPADHLAAGDHVDLHALLTGDVVARRVRVVQVDAGVAMVAVPLPTLPAVIRTFTTGDVVPVLVR